MASAQLFTSRASIGLSKAGAVKAPRTSAGRPRAVVVRASQEGPHELPMKMFGALAAAQLALLPIAGPAMADITTDLLPKSAKSQLARDRLNAKTSGLPSLKETAQSAGDALSGDSNVTGNAKMSKAKRQVKSAAKGAGIDLPVSGTALYDYSALQTDVGLFDFGKKVEQSKDKVQSKAGEVESKASNAGDKVAGAVDQAGSASYNIFDFSSVKEAGKSLKQNIENAAAEKSDPAERVLPIGKPGETQEENAERIRIQSENTKTPFGDARAPTGS